ncbi:MULTISPECIES: hypothetical protein [unclassified Bradyrhizobium]|uniref:hypothetical protein n=1 Tax=unclassified Bradyrhizobium TaxID=2631580 RepID=UPI001CD27DF2|nr:MULTISPECIES: hypothetical protein [unclassified Bradyrhizobium]
MKRRKRNGHDGRNVCDHSGLTLGNIGLLGLFLRMSCRRRGCAAGEKEMQMNTKRSLLAACAILTLSAGVAVAGPCNTGSASADKTDKDAGSGPVTVGSAQSHTSGSASDSSQHPPTSTMNRASGESPASSEDAQRQMQSEPTAAQRAAGAKPNAEMADKDC